MQFRVFFVLCLLFSLAIGAARCEADLLLRLSGLNGESFHQFQAPGEEITLSLELVDNVGFSTWNGGKVTLDTGSDATFQQAIYLLDGDGEWSADPGEGETQRGFVGAPVGTHTFFAAGESLELGRIVLRAGSVAPNQIFETSMFDVEMLDISDNEWNVDLQNFSYSVVPEPSSMLLLGTALCGLVARRRRQA